MKILFVSLKALIDKNSGAALELLTIMEELAERGHKCVSFTLNCYDVGDDYKHDEDIDPRLSPKHEPERLFHHDKANVRHHLYVGDSKDTMKITRSNLDNFIVRANRFIDHFQPQVVLFFGPNELLPILQYAKSLGARIAFYAGTASYAPERKALFDFADILVTPTGFIDQIYRERFGKSSTIIPTTLPFDISPPDENVLSARRLLGNITLINPTPDKGGHLFLHLSTRMRRAGRLCLCVESRGTRDFWSSTALPPNRLENVIWAPFQSDVRLILNSTAVLLMPSLVKEAAGKVVAEAMALGVPCIGYDIGGLGEQIGEGGLTIPFAIELEADPQTGNYSTEIPPQAIDAWEEQIISLLTDPQRYNSLSSQALNQAAKYELHSVCTAWEGVLSQG